jgi:hypothetical protein
VLTYGNTNSNINGTFAIAYISASQIQKWIQDIRYHTLVPLSSAEPYEFLVKLRNITWETNYVIVSQNALGMMGRRNFVNHRSHPPPPPRRAPLNVLYYPYIIPTILYNWRRVPWFPNLKFRPYHRIGPDTKPI